MKWARRWLKSDPVRADNSGQVMEDQLASIREWAQATVDALQEPPWATRRSQHVIALIDEMLAPAPLSPECSGRRSPRVGNIIDIENARRGRARRAARR